MTFSLLVTIEKYKFAFLTFHLTWFIGENECVDAETYYVCADNLKFGSRMPKFNMKILLA